MVKFAKELESQLVPEWQGAYCSYVELKNDLKRIQHHRTYTRTGTTLGILSSTASTKAANLTRTFTRQFSTHSRPDFMASMSVKPGVHSKDVVAVTKRKTDAGEVFLTELHEPLSISPQDRTYFARLDAQVTKVNKFYKKKETENIARACVLEKKMYELIHAQEVHEYHRLREFNALAIREHHRLRENHQEVRRHHRLGNRANLHEKSRKLALRHFKEDS